MSFDHTRSVVFTLLISVISIGVADDTSSPNWTQFRGHEASGVAEGWTLPRSWNVEDGTNVLWRTKIPGMGHACPVVSDAAVYILTADSRERSQDLKVGLYGDIAPAKEDFPFTWTLYCLFAGDGRVCWKRDLHTGVPLIKRHTKASHANSTPATDGNHVVVQLGSEGLYCLNRCGDLLWQKDFGVLDSGYFQVKQAQWGFASSPIIWRGRVYVQCDVQDDSFIACLDVRTGDEYWRISRDDVPTWSTPTIHSFGKRNLLVANGFKHAAGYDALTGDEVWSIGEGGDIPVPTPIVAHNRIYLSSAHGGKAPLTAVQPSAQGRLNRPAEAGDHEMLSWHHAREATYMQTPIVYRGLLYACRDSGVLTVFDAVTGEKKYRQRLGSGTGFTASPVAGDGKLYFTSEQGDVYVLAAGPEYRLLAKNTMGETCMATPALSRGRLLVRGRDTVFCLRETAP